MTAIIPPFTRIVSSGESWSYLDNGTDPGNDWRSLNYDDLSWKIAQSPLGYGEEAVVGDVGFGDSPDNKHATTYFRKTFKFMGASEIVSSKIRIRKDDGVAVYLNGTEIVRDNLSTNADASTFADSAIDGDDESQVKEYMVDSSLLLDGENAETYRLYEALECECIPIVENAYKYYDRLFYNNPFIKVDKWIEAKVVIEEWGNDQIKQKREECRTWWNQYKNQLQEFIVNKINL